MNNCNNNYFMGQQGHYRPRSSQNDGGMFGPGHVRKMGPMHHRFPHQYGFPQNHVNGYMSHGHERPRQPRFPPPVTYFRHDNSWNSGNARRRFPNCNNPPFQQRFGDRRRQMIPEKENRQPPQYVLRKVIGDDNFPPSGRINRRYTEVSASLNFTIKTGNYEEMAPAERRRHTVPMVEGNYLDYPDIIIEPDADVTDSSDSFDDSMSYQTSDPVAVGSDPVLFSTEAAFGSNGNYSQEDPPFSPGRNDEDEIEISQEEEYEPENPDIDNTRIIHPASTTVLTFTPNTDFDNNQHFMASCDDEGFHEAFVGVVISRYPSVLGRQIEVAGYGAWFSDGHKRNLSGVLKIERPQNIKAIMIHGSARTIESMKREGYSRIRINLETEYLNSNVLRWISKYMENSNNIPPPSNWDEVKYLPEILELCNAASGMIIKWSHCCNVSLKKSGIEKAKQLAKKATDAWMKDYLNRQESVGTADYSQTMNKESDKDNTSKGGVQRA